MPSIKHVFSLLVSFLLLSSIHLCSATSPKGTIVQPVDGTTIAPNSKFNFTYNVLADYSVSTFYYHVWLLSLGPFGNLAPPTLQDLFTDGYYFGRFDYPNYPAVPYAKNPAPPQLTMPDFSTSPGGYAAGERGTNVPLRLVVIEEWGNGDPALGHKLHVDSVAIIYNATWSFNNSG